jgi:hypothetical protein
MVVVTSISVDPTQLSSPNACSVGFHDTSVDDVLAKQDKFKPITLRDAEGARRDEIEGKARKEDKKKTKELEKNNMPKAIAQLNK